MKVPVVLASFILVLNCVDSATAFCKSNYCRKTLPAQCLWNEDPVVAEPFVERPLLKKFGQGIRTRIINSEKGFHHEDQVGAYTSIETIPRLKMQCSDTDNTSIFDSIVSRHQIREAFFESSTNNSELHGRSSGSGCTIIHLRGEDAASIHGLVRYANRFFDQIDNVKENEVSDAGVFRVEDHVYVGFDDNVNSEGKMQFLDTRKYAGNEDTATLLPLELEGLVGSNSMDDAQKGMNCLLDIGTQIASAVLGMNSKSAKKLICDGKSTYPDYCDSSDGDQVSNSYHRLIRYLQPQVGAVDAAFGAHVDLSFLTLIPLPDRPGLEVWCPSIDDDSVSNNESNTRKGGEWVRPTVANNNSDDNNAYIIVLAGVFLQLTSDGKVPVCIHRVIPPKPPPSCAFGGTVFYQPRVSAPLFLRPKKGKDAMLNAMKDLGSMKSMFIGSKGLYHEVGLLDECDEMHLWSAHNVMKLH
jgi:hypothetical protein